MINSSDWLYALPKSNTILDSGNKSGANNMWFSTPSCLSFKYLMRVSGSYIGYAKYEEDYLGFRPVVCLKSDAGLTKVSDTEYRID